MKAEVNKGFGPRPYIAYCVFHQDGVRHKARGRADAWADAHNAGHQAICDICGVDHSTTHADLSHGIIRLLIHAQERITWMEWPINGDMIARQRAGILSPALLYSWVDPEEIDWDRIAAQQEDNRG